MKVRQAVTKGPNHWVYEHTVLVEGKTYGAMHTITTTERLAARRYDLLEKQIHQHLSNQIMLAIKKEIYGE